MRICQWSTQEALGFRKVGVKPSCRSHEHLLPREAEARVVSGMVEWVGQKRRAVAPTRKATDRGYDNARITRPLTPRALELGSCKCCGAGSFQVICHRCRLDGISDRVGNSSQTVPGSV